MNTTDGTSSGSTNDPMQLSSVTADEPATADNSERESDNEDSSSSHNQPRSLSNDKLLPLIINQLAEMGYGNLAMVIQQHTETPGPVEPSNRLAELCYTALYQSSNDNLLSLEHDPSTTSISAAATAATATATEAASKDTATTAAGATTATTTGTNNEEKASSSMSTDTPMIASDIQVVGEHLDLDAPIEEKTRSTPVFVLYYKTTHKGEAKCSAFSTDGQLASTGSTDSSVKLINVDKMRKHNDADRPVIRTFYDHTGPVNDVAFHPNGMVLASCSDDRFIKLYDLTRSGSKRGFRSLHDAYPVNSIAFHPSGDFLAAATQDNYLRIHDLHRGNCYIVNKNASDQQHMGPIQQVTYSGSGRWLATGSSDGDVRVWDAVSGKSVRVISGAHTGRVVTSVRITKNEKYLLTSGCDSTVRLWDLSSGRMILTYEGATHTEQITRATMNYTEDLVMASDEITGEVVIWDARTATPLQRWRGKLNDNQRNSLTHTHSC
ncbi:WD40-repeat-containing domain protein [Syncephalis plumigaleata]|nr:WD40-repeat-containing domain protein [Syncephalis plumigaleata]